MGKTYVSVALDGDDRKMLEICLRKYSRFRGKKDAVLVEALRTYFLNQEQTGWRQVKTPGA